MSASVKTDNANGNRRHLLVWIGATALFFGSIFRFLRILALDLDALIQNVYPIYEISFEWIAWARFFIQAGALPLLVIFFSGHI